MLQLARRYAALLATLLVSSHLLAAQQPPAPAPFTPLFDGRTLNGWVVENSDK